MDSAKNAIEQIPEIYFNKLTEMAYLLSGEAKFEAAEKQKRVSSENLIQMMWKIAEYYEEKGEYKKAIAEINKALQLIAVTDNRQLDVYEIILTKRSRSFLGIYIKKRSYSVSAVASLAFMD